MHDDMNDRTQLHDERTDGQITDVDEQLLERTDRVERIPADEARTKGCVSSRCRKKDVPLYRVDAPDRVGVRVLCAHDAVDLLNADDECREVVA